MGDSNAQIGTPAPQRQFAAPAAAPRPSSLQQPSLATRKRGSVGSGRKRGPIYQHYAEVPQDPTRNYKRMQCVYCGSGLNQDKNRMKHHLAHLCSAAPPAVRDAYHLVIEQGAKDVSVDGEAPTAVATAAVNKTPRPKRRKPDTSVLTSPVPGVERFQDRLAFALLAADVPLKLLDGKLFRESVDSLMPAASQALTSSSGVVERLARSTYAAMRRAVARAKHLTFVLDRRVVENGVWTSFVVVTDARESFLLDSRPIYDPQMCFKRIDQLKLELQVPLATSSHVCFAARPDDPSWTKAVSDGSYATTHPLRSSLVGRCLARLSLQLLRDLVVHAERTVQDSIEAVDRMLRVVRDLPVLRETLVREWIDKQGPSTAQSASQPALYVPTKTNWLSIVAGCTNVNRVLALPLQRAVDHSAVWDEWSRQCLAGNVINPESIKADSSTWPTLALVDQLLMPLNYLAVASELPLVTSGQFLSAWIWLLGCVARSPLIDGASGRKASFTRCFLHSVQHSVDDHALVCLVLDPRVHGVGLSTTGLRKVRSLALQYASSFIPGFNETSFLRSFNSYVKREGDFSDAGVWNAVMTNDPLLFWSDFEDDDRHSQLAQVAKAVCSFVPQTCSMNECWKAMAETMDHLKYVDDEAVKTLQVKHAAREQARADPSQIIVRLRSIWSTLAPGAADPTSDGGGEGKRIALADKDDMQTEMLHKSEHSGAVTAEFVSSVLQRIHVDSPNSEPSNPGMVQSGSALSASQLDESWLDATPAGAKKIQAAFSDYFSSLMVQ